jgi:hypothetical protein
MPLAKGLLDVFSELFHAANRVHRPSVVQPLAKLPPDVQLPAVLVVLGGTDIAGL